MQFITCMNNTFKKKIHLKNNYPLLITIHHIIFIIVIHCSKILCPYKKKKNSFQIETQSPISATRPWKASYALNLLQFNTDNSYLFIVITLNATSPTQPLIDHRKNHPIKIVICGHHRKQYWPRSSSLTDSNRSWSKTMPTLIVQMRFLNAPAAFCHLGWPLIVGSLNED